MINSINDPGIDLSPFTFYRDYPVHLERLNWLYKSIQSTRKINNQPISILDVGCGTGNITVPLGLIPNAHILGIDLDQKNVDIAKSINDKPNVKIEFGYLQDYDLHKFDYIIFTEVLEHIPNYAEILDYMSKNISRNTLILITIPNGRGPFEIAMKPMYLMRKVGLNGFIRKVKKIVGKKEPYATNQEETPHVNFFTEKQLKRDFKKYNFKIEEFTKSFVFSPILETYLPFISLKKFSYYDNRLAQKLPKCLVSGWYLIISPSNYSSSTVK